MRNIKAGWWFLLVIVGMTASLWAEEKKPAHVDGKWKWTYKTKDGKDAEVFVKLRQDGEKLSGAYVARDGKETPLENGKVNGDELSFEVNREMPAGKELFH